MSATISLQPSTVRVNPGRARTHRSDVAPPVRVRRRESEATYRRRRAVVGTAMAVFVAVGAVSTHDVLAGSGSVPASAAESQPARTVIVAKPGDTLWGIASQHHGEISMMRYVDKLVELNGGASIQAGQQVILP
jgi:LysM repeat protein